MTEYGRGQGSEPWHPEDPLYGDGGWGGQQAHAGQQSPYGGQPQHYPQQPQQQQQYGDWNQGQQGGYDQQQHQYYDPQGQQQYGGHIQPQQYHQGGWDATGTHGQVPYAADPGDPYGQQPVAYGAEQPDFYGTPDAYPPPQPPGRRGPETEPETDWDPGPDQGEHAFFSGGDDDDDDFDDDPRGRGGRGDRRGKDAKGGKGAKKRRSGCACLVVVLVFGGGLGGVGYLGFQYFQNRFGPAPDYEGSGNGESVTVEIPKGAGGYDIGRKLKEAGVVESVDAFVSAQGANPNGKSIQDGIYTLQKHMSAASAVELMLSPKSRSNLVLAEGLRNVAVYALIDKRLGVKKGTTEGVAKKDYKRLGLPSWALNHPSLKDPLEGFLYPSSYAVAKGQKPEAVLKEMVGRASEKYDELGVENKAKSLGLDGPWQLLTVASLVQAEGTSHDDFRKMAEVVYNRLKPGNPETYGALEFDSTYNYVKNQSKIDLSIGELRRYNNPYNTYYAKGLPPGPIGNPGEEALNGALDPTHDGWYYFISMDGKTSRFTKTLADHEKLVNEWNASRNKN
ncbi:endolytic transglycosylase MltG [Streptomyces brasiliensis]|uniref:Endolytic murein transglycosylase n=1 Tax=Streptomyces brasiliensis TaxID=1954 RepID=A0A917NH79_9ACTN|nr:endolytic transglycosylase MltG [Streptomyces brasiliensis]GGJ00293.1 membrane protein [Streptomyces brasiliensis]